MKEKQTKINQNTESNEMEIWKDIAGFEEYYQVSNLGRVRSKDRIIATSVNSYLKKGRVLKLHYDNKHPYLSFALHVENTNKTCMVHRIVAETFIPNPKGLPCVNHKDEDKRNNNVSNLEWCDYSYNATYKGARYRNVINRTKNGSKNSERPVLMFNLNGDFIKEFRSTYDAAREIGVSRVRIVAVCTCYRGSKQTKGFKFKYKDDYEKVL